MSILLSWVVVGGIAWLLLVEDGKLFIGTFITKYARAFRLPATDVFLEAHHLPYALVGVIFAGFVLALSIAATESLLASGESRSPSWLNHWVADISATAPWLTLVWGIAALQITPLLPVVPWFAVGTFLAMVIHRLLRTWRRKTRRPAA